MSISLAQRFYVLKRDRFCCVYCGAHPPDIQVEVDHFYPASRGGTDEVGNLVTACMDCNRGKGTMLIEDDLPEKDSPLWRWILRGVTISDERIRERLLFRDPDESLADVVEKLWPEADY